MAAGSLGLSPETATPFPRRPRAEAGRVGSDSVVQPPRKGGTHHTTSRAPGRQAQAPRGGDSYMRTAGLRPPRRILAHQRSQTQGVCSEPCPAHLVLDQEPRAPSEDFPLLPLRLEYRAKAKTAVPRAVNACSSHAVNQRWGCLPGRRIPSRTAETTTGRSCRQANVVPDVSASAQQFVRVIGNPSTQRGRGATETRW